MFEVRAVIRVCRPKMYLTSYLEEHCFLIRRAYYQQSSPPPTLSCNYRGSSGLWCGETQYNVLGVRRGLSLSFILHKLSSKKSAKADNYLTLAERTLCKKCSPPAEASGLYIIKKELSLHTLTLRQRCSPTTEPTYDCRPFLNDQHDVSSTA
jgi:hypothetical protein